MASFHHSAVWSVLPGLSGHPLVLNGFKTQLLNAGQTGFKLDFGAALDAEIGRSVWLGKSY